MDKKPTIYDGNRIGNNLITGHFVLIRENNKIGNNVKIGSYTEIAHDCRIGDNVKIHSKCFICENSILKDNCWIGPMVALINDEYPQTKDPNRRKAPVIGKNAIIGAKSIIMPGVYIGNNSLIGAGSVITRDVPDGEVWVGNPAIYLKKRNKLDAYSSL